LPGWRFQQAARVMDWLECMVSSLPRVAVRRAGKPEPKALDEVNAMTVRTFHVYRYDPDKDAKPTMQTMVLVLDGRSGCCSARTR
jgi:hypothetical protein